MKAEADPEKTLSSNHESLAVFYNPTKEIRLLNLETIFVLLFLLFVNIRTECQNQICFSQQYILIKN